MFVKFVNWSGFNKPAAIIRHALDPSHPNGNS